MPEVYEEVSQCYVGVEPAQLIYWCFAGMPMGWSWAMVFAQEAMSVPPRVVALMTADGVGGLLEDGRPVPRFGPQAPVVSMYVDNA